MRAIKKLDNYRLYKVDGYHELWFGKYQDGVRVGYVSNPANFEMACHEAEMEFKALNRDFEIYG